MALQYLPIKSYAQYISGIASDFTTKNPVLRLGELGFEIDTNQVKIGNGKDRWNDIAYLGAGAVSGSVASQSTLNEILAMTQTILKSDFLTASDISSGFWGA